MIVTALNMTASITPKFSPAQLKAEGLTPDEYQMICDRLGRELKEAETKDLFCFISVNM